MTEQFIEAHYTNNEDIRVLVPESLWDAGSEKMLYPVMEQIVKNRLSGKKIGGPLVLACHDGIPDQSLYLTETEQAKYFPPSLPSSVRVLGSH